MNEIPTRVNLTIFTPEKHKHHFIKPALDDPNTLVFLYSGGGFQVVPKDSSPLLDKFITGETYSLSDLKELTGYTPLRRWLIITTEPVKGIGKAMGIIGNNLENLDYLHIGTTGDYMGRADTLGYYYITLNSHRVMVYQRDHDYYKVAKDRDVVLPRVLSLQELLDGAAEDASYKKALKKRAKDPFEL